MSVALVPGDVIFGVGVKECERRLLGQEVGRPQLYSPVSPPGPVGTAGHCTGSVPNNTRLCGPLNLGPRGEAARGRVQGPLLRVRIFQKTPAGIRGCL